MLRNCNYNETFSEELSLTRRPFLLLNQRIKGFVAEIFGAANELTVSLSTTTNASPQEKISRLPSRELLKISSFSPPKSIHLTVKYVYLLLIRKEPPLFIDVRMRSLSFRLAAFPPSKSPLSLGGHGFPEPPAFRPTNQDSRRLTLESPLSPSRFLSSHFILYQRGRPTTR